MPADATTAHISTRLFIGGRVVVGVCVEEVLAEPALQGMDLNETAVEHQ